MLIKNSNSPTFFTIVAKNYISYARTLCQSIRLHYPESKIYVALCDSPDPALPILDDPFEIIDIDLLGLPRFEFFKFRYDVMEFSTAIKPYVFKWIYSNTSSTQIIYLDPDILVTSPLYSVSNALNSGYEVVLTPHLTHSVDDGYQPDEQTMLKVGVFNLGFIATSLGSSSSMFIDWWCARLEKGAIVDLENGLFTDQKWIDLVPSLFNNVYILKNPGYNLAYWNLSHRPVQRIKDRWFAGKEPLAFIHFSGVNPLKPNIFSKHQNRFDVEDIGELKPLYMLYVEKLLKNNYKETISIPFGLGNGVSGVFIDKPIRFYFRRYLDFTSGEMDTPEISNLTIQFFNELEPSLPGNSLISRYMYGLYLTDFNIQKHFQIDSHSQNEYSRFTYFFVHQAEVHYKLNKTALKLANERLLRASKALSKDINIKKWSKQYYLNLLIQSIYKIYTISPKFFNNLKPIVPKRLINRIRKESWLIANDDPSFNYDSEDVLMMPPIHNDGITLFGYLQGDFGVAQNLRSVAGACESVGIPFDIYALKAESLYSHTPTIYDERVVDNPNYKIQLFCINADQVRYTFDKLSLDQSSTFYRIGYWFWELSKFPEEWLHALDYFDELWAPSLYIKEMLSNITKKPVIYMPVGVEFDVSKKYERDDFELPDNDFLFLFSYDFHSFIKRKNPEAVLEAFIKEFSKKKDRNICLIIKTSYGEHYPETYLRLLEIANSDKRIHIINKILTRDEMYGLISLCDSYVSLHRAEGFGLGMAEAMYLGKPVIGTDYSGNKDFMYATNSCLVDQKMIPLERDSYPFWLNQEWADPNIATAQAFMRKLFVDVDYRNTIGLAGMSTIKEFHSFDRVGKLISQRTNEILEIIKESYQ